MFFFLIIPFVIVSCKERDPVKLKIEGVFYKPYNKLVIELSAENNTREPLLMWEADTYMGNSRWGFAITNPNGSILRIVRKSDFNEGVKGSKFLSLIPGEKHIFTFDLFDGSWLWPYTNMPEYFMQTPFPFSEKNNFTIRIHAEFNGNPTSFEETDFSPHAFLEGHYISSPYSYTYKP